MLYWLKKKIFTFLGDIKVSGWTHPMWFTINAHGYKLKGAAYRDIRDLIKPGDILIRRYDGYFSTYALPGFWTHCGLYIGDDGDKPEQVIHAISDGVIQEDVLNFLRTDYLRILRAAPGKGGKNTKAAIKKAKEIVGAPYDFGFDFKNTNRFSCTELITYCYPNLVKGKKRFWKYTVVADDFKESDKLKTIWDSTQNKMHTTGVAQAFLAEQCPKDLKEKT